MRKHDVTTLPKWAQDRMGVLERDIEHYKAVAYETNQGDTDIYIRRGLDERYYLPRYSKVTFVIDEDKGERISVGITDSWAFGKSVAVIAEGASSTLLTHPQSGNVINVTNRDLR